MFIGTRSRSNAMNMSSRMISHHREGAEEKPGRLMGAPQGCRVQISWPAVSLMRESVPNSRRRAVRDVVIYGVCGGALIALLKLAEYRFLVVAHSGEIYGGLSAVTCAVLGIWLGRKLTRRGKRIVVKEVAVRAGEPFAADDKKREDLGITRR